MKKIMKKISMMVLAILIVLSNRVIVNAYDSGVNIDDNIVIPTSIHTSSTNYVSLKRDLKNNSAVVSQQQIVITSNEFSTINAKINSSNKYSKEQLQILSEKLATLKKEKEQLDVLKEAASKTDATEEEKNAYTSASEKYNTNVEAYNNYRNQVDSKIEQNQKELEAIIPSFNNNNWKNISLSKTTDSSNDYAIEALKNESYYVLWIKVTVNGKDYYNYGVYCDRIEETEEPKEEEPKKEEPKEEVYKCEIKDGKYYDKNGKEVTESVYKKDCTVPSNPKTGLTINIAYGVLITLVATSSYVVVRKYRKFSR